MKEKWFTYTSGKNLSYKILMTSAYRRNVVLEIIFLLQHNESDKNGEIKI